MTIEVDEEVFAYLQSKATALVDTPNTVLRRELLGRDEHAAARRTPTAVPQSPSLAAPSGLPNMPFGTPAALQQILWVVYLVKKNGRPRSTASVDVARFARVTPQTVSDKYGRQLGLTADRFDLLLQEPTLSQVEQLLKDKFRAHADLIEHFLRSWRSAE